MFFVSLSWFLLSGVKMSRCVRSSITTAVSVLQAAVYKICKEMYCEGMEDEPFSEGEPDLIGDR